MVAESIYRVLKPTPDEPAFAGYRTFGISDL